MPSVTCPKCGTPVAAIPTAIPSSEYLPLLDAIHAAADICTNLGAQPESEDVGGFGLAVLSRWASAAQAFVTLRNAGLLTEAYAIARVGSELAIMSAWAKCGKSKRFPTPAARVKAIREDDNHSTRVWLDKMHERSPAAPPLYDATTPWGRVLAAAKPPGLPKLAQMAECSKITRDLYAFAYRGESGAVHSATRVLATHGAGKPPIREALMVHNVLAAALVVFRAVSNLIEDERAADIAKRLQQVLRDRVQPTKLSS